MLSVALPGCDVVYFPRAAVGKVMQGGVCVVEGRGVILLLDVVRQQVGEAARKQEKVNEKPGRQATTDYI